MRTPSLKKQIESLKFNYVNSDITEEHFPPQKVRKNPKVFHFNEDVSTEEALKRMKAEGYEPANLHELLAYAKDEWNGKDTIVALGSVWRDMSVGRVCPYLDEWDGGRKLLLLIFRNDWDVRCRFLAYASSPRTSEPLTTESESLGSLGARISALETFKEKVEKILKL